MKYTRYDLKRDKSTMTFMILIFIILLSAFILGTFIFQVIIKDSSNLNYGSSSSNSQNKTADASQGDSALKNNYIKFIAVQGGMYKDKNNADEEKKLLAKYGLPFCTSEADKTRVFLGIFLEGNANKVIKSLTEQKVENSKMVFTINKDSTCNTEIAEIINANLEILTKLSAQDVKSIQTEELKKWCSSLENKEEENNKNKLILKELKEYINKLPKEMAKENSEENYIYLFNILKKMSLS